MQQRVTYSYQGHGWFDIDNEFIPVKGSCVSMPESVVHGKFEYEKVYEVQNVVVGWLEEDGNKVRLVSVRLK